MKKTTFILLLFISSLKSYTQSIFNENFDTTTDLLASGWVMYNDNHNLNSGYDSIFINAWEIVDWAEEAPNKAASTSSAFIEEGPADRWLVTPPITIPSNASNISLTFKARSFDIAPRQDGFKLKIATTTNSKTSFTTTLLSVPNTPNTLLEQVPNISVNLSAYAGQTIYLAWIDDFENGNILAIDDIDISVNALAIKNNNVNHFKIYPNPSNGTFQIDCLNNITEINIYDVLGKLVYSKEGNYENETTIETTISKGVYILKAISDTKTCSSQKIVIE